MNTVKSLSVFCLILFLNCLFNSNILGQNTETPAQVDKKSNAPEVKVLVDDENQTSDNRQKNEKYRIGFQDILEIQVFRHPELSQVVNVSPDGTILMPKIDRPIVAVCKTERELKADVETLYKSYLKNPFVNVRVAQQLSQPFAVIGAVEKPGSFYMNRKIRLLELLAYAGGPKIDKAGANIQVARIGNVSGCSENADADDDVVFLGYKIKEVLEGKENPWMQPGDIVSVLEVEQAFVVGNVKEPSKVPLKEPVTLTQAIAYAGGLAPEALTSKVKIQRQVSGSALKTETIYDLKDIASKKIPDPVLQANDIVEVPKDGVKSVRNGIIKALSGGIGGLFYRF